MLEKEGKRVVDDGKRGKGRRCWKKRERGQVAVEKEERRVARRWKKEGDIQWKKKKGWMEEEKKGCRSDCVGWAVS